MALTFKDEGFLQGSVGVSDVVATVSATTHVFGWLGGLESIRSILDSVPNPFGQKASELQFGDGLQLSGISGYVLTDQGPRTQLIGLTLCDLAHEYGIDAARDLFVECLFPCLFSGTDELAGGIASQLSDTAIRTRIMNDCASRGLIERLTVAIRSLVLASGDKEWLRSLKKTPRNSLVDNSELQSVGGLLKWIGSGSNTASWTRSSLAARVAAC